MSFIGGRSAWQYAIISGLITGIAYQPWHLGFLAWFGLIPLLHVWVTHDAKENARFGYLFGITHNFIAFYWIGFNSGASFGVVLLSLIAAVFYLGIYWAAAGWVIGNIKFIGKRLALFPFLIVSMEWIRSFGPLGFPWGNIVLSQMDYLQLIQLMEFAGSYGVTLWVITLNVILYILYLNFNSNKKIGIIVGIFLVGLWFVGNSRIKEFYNSNEKMSVAILQPNIDPNAKWDFSKKKETIAYMDSLHSIAIKLNPDFIIFPETALPSYLTLDGRVRNMIQTKVDSSKIPVLTGTVDRVISGNGDKQYFNSTMFLTPNHKYILYNKLHLVPFAEYIPLSGQFPSLKNLNFGQGNFSHGTEYTVFKWKNTKFSNLICYESSIPKIVRKFIQNGANLITIQTNDGWLGKSAGPYQHYDIAKIRAIENRVPVIRSANTGISGLILANGISINEQPVGKTAVFTVSVPIGEAGSFYSQYGDVFALICFVIFLLLGPLTCLRK
ncbi:MAG: apolipoprotein N-acyltransferase [Candidatus Marinimicrobia bacterium]|jgi:apolipoprotein N-acyltransferase|nr:apolipoprotein N-acyltransferase [Candidatus Neomarinimicrobiota bacterium]MBT3501408.1 apolipoprotein N-acyltransferase [Candidatus Neomarinimicrobiota bacterium]MBT3839453.1 apolipoprotein N-acyltransferase [Candidatus Neomarinimicrobiota bacterium]MBT3998562.1 apolipoprotein N-acyltransferase [Candidatus Neomarinimicrobiota bacterium]MBT4283034.1 apolipoprotein N-acyltransferase [Candidatus Neomarinimicrobiota bacterium]